MHGSTNKSSSPETTNLLLEPALSADSISLMASEVIVAAGLFMTVVLLGRSVYDAISLFSLLSIISRTGSTPASSHLFVVLSPTATITCFSCFSCCRKESTSPSGTSLPKGFFRLSLNSSGRVKTDLSLCKITEHPHLSAYLQSVSSRLGKPKNRSHI